MVKVPPYLAKDVSTQLPEAQKTPSRMSSKKTTPGKCCVNYRTPQTEENESQAPCTEHQHWCSRGSF